MSRISGLECTELQQLATIKMGLHRVLRMEGREEKGRTQFRKGEYSGQVNYGKKKQYRKYKE